jgi:hypothetical protein
MRKDVDLPTSVADSGPAISTSVEGAAQQESFSPGPWELVEATEHHGPYVVNVYGRDVADCYCMSNPLSASIRNGGDSYPVNHCGDEAHANARLIAAAPDLLYALGLALGILCHLDEAVPAVCIEEAIDEARAAIAKATGAQP